VTDAGQAQQRATGRKMAMRYAAGLACGHLIGTADAAAIVIPLHGQFAGDARAYFAPGPLPSRPAVSRISFRCCGGSFLNNNRIPNSGDRPCACSRGRQ
jgi:hypothetical protein